MDREIDGVPTVQYLWQRKRIVPFLKVDKGLADQQDHVQLMNPIDRLDEILARAKERRMFGTKMRSVIKDADERGITQIVAQQFEVGARIAAAGLVPILEPEVSINAPNKDDAEALLHDNIRQHLGSWPAATPLMLKLTIPTQPGRYRELSADRRVLRVLALSGGYSRDEACERVAENAPMIASFSRALLEGLSDDQTDEQFHARLDATVQQFFQASANQVDDQT